ncbi:hypothetical protein CPC08DRAFT_309254 [Agrocybe pediades]|nr:hypothetical protein CPC08DRAFT_309254 [Agrocybe pediades]
MRKMSSLDPFFFWNLLFPLTMWLHPRVPPYMLYILQVYAFEIRMPLPGFLKRTRYREATAVRAAIFKTYSPQD